jgi:hypothetical protein
LANLADLDLAVAYGAMDDRMNGFYFPALSRSVSYDRTVGLFSAGSLAVAARGVDAMIRNRGHMRLLTGAVLETADSSGLQGIQDVLSDSFLSMLENAEPWMIPSLGILGWMAAEKMLEVRIVLPLAGMQTTAGAGVIAERLFHMGIFTDTEGNQVCFSGTVRESHPAGDQVYEHLFVFKSWESGGLHLQAIRQYFERLWEGKETGWLTLGLPGAVIDRLISFSSRRASVRAHRGRADTGKAALNPKVKEEITEQFMRDLEYLPADRSGKLQDALPSEPGEPAAAVISTDNTEACRLPLLRLATGKPDVLVVYYHLKDKRIAPLSCLDDLDEVFEERVHPEGLPVSLEIKAREHFFGLLQDSEHRRLDRLQAVRDRQKAVLKQEALNLLVKAAFCDIAQLRHATLFDGDLLAADFDTATVQRQGKKGFPFSEMISWLTAEEFPLPDRNDAFWHEIEKKPLKAIRGIEVKLAEEGRDLVAKWRMLSEGVAEETTIPRVAVNRYFPREQKEKPRLALIVSPPRKERFTRYLPFYSMESAFDRIVRGKDPAEEGWMEVEIAGKLSRSMFVIRMEGDAMDPLISDGHFAVFDSEIKGPFEGSVLLVYAQNVIDPNRGGHLTIRRFRTMRPSESSGRLDGIVLEPLHPDYQPFHLINPAKDVFQIIARYVGGVGT